MHDADRCGDAVRTRGGEAATSTAPTAGADALTSAEAATPSAGGESSASRCAPASTRPVLRPASAAAPPGPSATLADTLASPSPREPSPPWCPVQPRARSRRAPRHPRRRSILGGRRGRCVGTGCRRRVRRAACRRDERVVRRGLRHRSHRVAAGRGCLDGSAAGHGDRAVRLASAACPPGCALARGFGAGLPVSGGFDGDRRSDRDRAEHRRHLEQRHRSGRTGRRAGSGDPTAATAATRPASERGAWRASVAQEAHARRCARSAARSSSPSSWRSCNCTSVSVRPHRACSGPACSSSRSAARARWRSASTAVCPSPSRAPISLIEHPSTVCMTSAARCRGNRARSASVTCSGDSPSSALGTSNDSSSGSSRGRRYEGAEAAAADIAGDRQQPCALVDRLDAVEQGAVGVQEGRLRDILGLGAAANGTVGEREHVSVHSVDRDLRPMSPRRHGWR